MLSEMRIWGTLALALTPGAITAQAQDTLLMDGKTASTSIRTLGGAPYVKLADMAKALGMIVVKRPDGRYEIIKAGGANQVQGRQGKVGDTLFDGRWRFRVVSVQTPESYLFKNDSVQGLLRGVSGIRNDENTHTMRAAPGYKLVVVQCRVTNGQKSVQTFWLGQRDVKNALTDTQGESYTPVGYDLEGAPTQSKPLLPGAAANFPILFSVSENTELNDLIFTLRNNDFSTGGAANEVRVSLMP